MEYTRFIGWDVHAATMAIAVADAGRRRSGFRPAPTRRFVIWCGPGSAPLTIKPASGAALKARCSVGGSRSRSPARLGPPPRWHGSASGSPWMIPADKLGRNSSISWMKPMRVQWLTVAIKTAWPHHPLARLIRAPGAPSAPRY